MVTRGWENVGCGTVCARAAPIAAVSTTVHSHAKIDREPARLVIDDHAGGNAADRDGDGGLAASGVDDRDIVAEAVCDDECLLVPRERNAPGALAHQDIGLHLARRHV